MMLRLRCLVSLALLLALPHAVSAKELWEDLKQPSGSIADFANILPPLEEANLDIFLRNANEVTKTAFIVVTVPDLAGGEIDDFANRLYQRWGIGDARTDQGVLLLISLGDRKVRIETGYGAEGVITDTIASQIIRNTLAPAFQQGAYAAGIDRAMRQLVGLVAEEQGVKVGGSAPLRGRGDGGNGWALLLFFLIFGLIMATNVSRSAYNGRHRGRGAYWGGPMIGGGFGGGRGGFGGGGGGFGGFGGGMSGGGGASGGW